jgi:HPr kinase/phosphorylase
MPTGKPKKTKKLDASTEQAQNTHGTGLVLGGVGLLLRGVSGAGKSLLALELIEDFDIRGEAGLLVSDDRIDLSVEDGQLMLAAPSEIAGLIELRGRGIISRPFIQKSQLHLVIDLVDEQIRFLEEDALTTTILGVEVACCPVPKRGLIDGPHQRMLVKEAIRSLG